MSSHWHLQLIWGRYPRKLRKVFKSEMVMNWFLVWVLQQVVEEGMGRVKYTLVRTLISFPCIIHLAFPVLFFTSLKTYVRGQEFTFPWAGIMTDYIFFYPKIMLFRKENISNRHPGGSWRTLNWDNSTQTQCLIICLFCSNNTTDPGWATEMCNRSITRQKFIIYLLESYDNRSTEYMCQSLLYKQSPHSPRLFPRVNPPAILLTSTLNTGKLINQNNALGFDVLNLVSVGNVSIYELEK